MKTVIIGFGYKAYNGKDTAANAILETFKHKFYIKKYALADALKVEVFKAFGSGALPEGAPAVDNAKLQGRIMNYGGHAQQMIDWVNLNKTALRTTLQWWGTEYRRAMDANYWVDLLDKRISADAPQVALVADVRFRNEMGWIRGRGGTVIKVTRTGKTLPSHAMSHVSELELDNVHFDQSIYSSTVPDLERLACAAFREIMGITQVLDAD